MGEGNVFVDIVCPLLGNILGVCMLLSPAPAVWAIRRTGTLGALNALPYPLTVLNCVGWIAYGLSLKDMWIVPANVVGLCGGLYFTMQVLPYITRKMQDAFMGVLVAGGLYFCVLGMIGCIGLDEDRRNQMWGIQCVVILMFYYMIPLSSMLEVVRTHNAASIYVPLAIGSTCNGGLWTAYGLFAVGDFNIWMPNGVGALLGLLQLSLRLAYGVRDHHPLDSELHSENGLHLDHPKHLDLGDHFGDHDGHHPHDLRAGSSAALLAAKPPPSHLNLSEQPQPRQASLFTVPTTMALGSPAGPDYLRPSTPAFLSSAPPGA